MGSYWLVSLPLVGTKEQTLSRLNECSASVIIMSENAKFDMPDLRVGTLDSLLALSDDLVKINAAVEAVVNKIRRQLGEFDPSVVDSGADMMVDGMMVENYLTRFQWNEANLPARRALRETIEKIQESVAKIEDDLKVKVADYNNVKGALSAAARKQGGSLAVRDLGSVVDPSLLVDSENLVTFIVVVQKHSVHEWLSTYETLCDYVVPRSSKLVNEDNDYALYTVVLFRRVEDNFTAAARDKGFQVRDFKYNPEAQAARTEEGTRMEGEFAEMKGQLEEWCRTSYGEAFGFWVHLCAVRLFVESILRYGLPPCFQAAVCKPQPRYEQKLRAALAANFGVAGSVHWKDVGLEDSKAGPGGDGETYPYVSFTLTI